MGSQNWLHVFGGSYRSLCGSSSSACYFSLSFVWKTHCFHVFHKPLQRFYKSSVNRRLVTKEEMCEDKKTFVQSLCLRKKENPAHADKWAAPKISPPPSVIFNGPSLSDVFMFEPYPRFKEPGWTDYLLSVQVPSSFYMGQHLTSNMEPPVIDSLHDLITWSTSCKHENSPILSAQAEGAY